MTTTLDPDALTGPLADIADELTAAGYSVHDPGCLKIINARGALADLTITESGLLTWEYRSREGSHIDPDQLTGIVTAILGQPGTGTVHQPGRGSHQRSRTGTGPARPPGTPERARRGHHALRNVLRTDHHQPGEARTRNRPRDRRRSPLLALRHRRPRHCPHQRRHRSHRHPSPHNRRA